jgi:hypothetical protein
MATTVVLVLLAGFAGFLGGMVFSGNAGPFEGVTVIGPAKKNQKGQGQ